jgi:uncharacterized Zn-finger protein
LERTFSQRNGFYDDAWLEIMGAAYDIAPVVADAISVHCPGHVDASNRHSRVFLDDWAEAKAWSRGMLSRASGPAGLSGSALARFLGAANGPGRLRGHQSECSHKSARLVRRADIDVQMSSASPAKF